MSEWISVDEKLPELTMFENQFSEDLLLWHCGDTIHLIGYYNDKDEWRIYHDSEKACEYITHWMPLPEPPKKNK